MNTLLDLQLYKARPTRPAAESLADDVLRGAGQIATFLFGDVTARRRVYDWPTPGPCLSSVWALRFAPAALRC